MQIPLAAAPILVHCPRPTLSPIGPDDQCDSTVIGPTVGGE